MLGSYRTQKSCFRSPCRANKHTQYLRLLLKLASRLLLSFAVQLTPNFTICFSVDAQLYLNIYYRYLYMTGFFCIFVYATPLIMLVYLNVKVILELRRARKNWGTINRNEQKELRASLMPLVSLNCDAKFPLQLIFFFLISQGEFRKNINMSMLIQALNKGDIIFYREGGRLFVAGAPEFFWGGQRGDQFFFSDP